MELCCLVIPSRDLLAAARSGDSRQRCAAAPALAIFDDAESHAALLELLRDRETPLRSRPRHTRWSRDAT